jgi:hypothetical protein
MNKEIFELDNGKLHLTISADAQWMKVEGPCGSWESRDLVTFIYGASIRLDAVRCGKVLMEKKENEIRFSVSQLVWMARFPGHGYLKPDPAPAISLSFRIALDGEEVKFITEPPEGMDNESCDLWFPKEPISFSTAVTPAAKATMHGWVYCV